MVTYRWLTGIKDNRSTCLSTEGYGISRVVTYRWLTGIQDNRLLGVCEWVNIDLRRFLHNEEISREKEAWSRDYALLLLRMTSNVLYSAQYHRLHCTLHAFEQFEALFMHSHYDKSGFEAGMSKLKPQSIRMSHLGRCKLKLVTMATRKEFQFTQLEQEEGGSNLFRMV